MKTAPWPQWGKQAGLVRSRFLSHTHFIAKLSLATSSDTTLSNYLPAPSLSFPSCNSNEESIYCRALLWFLLIKQ